MKDRWLVELNHHAPNTPKLLVGTKIDMRADEETKQKVKLINLRSVNIALVGGWMNISDWLWMVDFGMIKSSF